MLKQLRVKLIRWNYKRKLRRPSRKQLLADRAELIKARDAIMSILNYGVDEDLWPPGLRYTQALCNYFTRLSSAEWSQAREIERLKIDVVRLGEKADNATQDREDFQKQAESFREQRERLARENQSLRRKLTEATQILSGLNQCTAHSGRYYGLLAQSERFLNPTTTEPNNT